MHLLLIIAGNLRMLLLNVVLCTIPHLVMKISKYVLLVFFQNCHNFAFSLKNTTVAMPYFDTPALKFGTGQKEPLEVLESLAPCYNRGGFRHIYMVIRTLHFLRCKSFYLEIL